MSALSEAPDLWNDAARAQILMREKTHLEQNISVIRDIEQKLRDNSDLLALAEEEGDADLIKESESAIIDLRKITERRRLESLLSGEADGNDCYLQVNAGAGGTEAQDWAQMILRLYVRWSERRGYQVEVMERSDGEEAGIKSCTIKIAGHQAFGWLKHESGVHRLVRISPFDSNARRHTSFASVSVTPVVDESIDIEVLDKDLRVDTYRAQGAGGQHVNKTDSAVRMTHIPTGIVVACQAGRSQHQNRATAMEMLKARLYELELHKRQEAQDKINSAKTDIGWGHQIRSYVLHPYQMIKDMRTEVETTNSQAVLDGEIDMFLEASLAQNADGK